MNKSIVATLVLGCLLAVLPCAAADPPQVGRVESGTVRLGDEEVAAGSVLRGEGLLFSGSSQAVVLRLANGRRIEASRGSVLKLLKGEGDAFEVTVLQGTLSFDGAGGRRSTLGAGARVVLGRTPDGRVAESDRPDFGDDE